MSLIKPTSIRIEASTACQLKCPSCETAQGKTHEKLGRGFLAFNQFQQLIDENPWIKHVELSNWGEILLNPDLMKILEYAYEKKVILSATNGVNLNTAKPDVLEALVKYQFRALTCALDGASQETYQKYRVNGNFDRVIEHIKLINHYKELYQSEHPILQWQFIVFRHNEHEIDTARSLAASLNMKFYLKLSWDETIAQVKNPERIRQEIGAASRSEYHQSQGEGYLHKSICSQLWHSPQINWDGQLLGCCLNYWGDFGNAFDSNLEAALNGEKISYAREMLMGKAAASEGIPCTGCGHYQVMAVSKNWLTEQDIKLHKLQHSAQLRPQLQELWSQCQQV